MTPVLALAMPAKCGFVAFHGSGKGVTQLLFVAQRARIKR